jgi:flagellar P-ring protein precursor FlgI
LAILNLNRNDKTDMIMKLQTTLFIVLLLAIPVSADRIKDIVDVQGVRSNPLSGVGLVVGLADTGDSSLPSQQMLTNILRRSELVTSPDDLSGGNIALVMVTGDLGAFNRKGSRVDVEVSSIGDAESLKGGILLPTPLKGLDQQVYAVAQGPLSIAGWTASGDQGSVTKNHQTVARIPGGAIVEKQELATFVKELGEHRYITFNLRNSDFTTAENIGNAINDSFPSSAEVIDPGTVRVQIPDSIGKDKVAGFIDNITQKRVEVDYPAKVVINERTGTIVVGKNVSVSSVAISQGSLVVKIKETARVSQPDAPFTESATTEVVPETMISVDEEDGHLIPLQKSVTVSELANTLNSIGATPSDMIAIFNALKEAGALQAKLEIM